MINVDIAIIGGGPAGLAAALSAKDAGIKNIMIFERDKVGGILNQCIHDGFGLHYFGEQLTGPEYANRFEDRVLNSDINVRLNTMVLNISKDKIITATDKQYGLFKVKAKAVILAMGCRERPRGALNIPGTRPAGIFTAGTIQRLINIEGHLPGKNIVILGSGDIGLIMARRLTLETASVKAVCEILPYSSGLTRNIVQCLHDYNIPLKLQHTVTNIYGKSRLEKVEISKTDDNLKPIPGTQEYIDCDTLVLSVGLIPENDIVKNAGIKLDTLTGGPVTDNNLMTNIPGIFTCGNCLHVHDLVDYVTEESINAGRNAAEYINGKDKNRDEQIKITPGDNVRYTVPVFINKDVTGDIKILFRVSKIMENCTIVVKQNGNMLKSRKRLKCTPGEMEEISVKSEMLKISDKENNSVIIEVN